MSRWLRDQLQGLARATAGFSVVLDPDEAVVVADVQEVVPSAHVAVVGDWWALRRTYELLGRKRDLGGPALVLVVRGRLAGIALPWDIERGSSALVRIRLPGPSEVRKILSALNAEEADRAVAAVARSLDAVGALLGAVTGVSLERDGTAGQRLALATRLVVRPDLPSSLRRLAADRIGEPALKGLLADPPDTAALQRSWQEWVVGGGPAEWELPFSEFAGDLAPVFTAGLLHPVPRGARPLPPWAAYGVRAPTAGERVAALLQARPLPYPPSTAAGWIALAAWWGEIRAAAVGALPERQRAELGSVWEEVDKQFLPWLRANFGPLLSSAAPWPAAVHRIAPFLARRLRDGVAERILLIVLDGMGYAQWTRIRERAGLTVVQGGGTFTMLPTYTTVCRQAIFAGQLPLQFPETLWTTQAEARRWSAFWASEGISSGVTFRRVDGRVPGDRIDLGSNRIVGVVVNAVDEIMHGSELLGDAQVAAAVDAWADSVFLRDLVERATAADFEIWVTADHGNVECHPAGRVAEGLAVEVAGKRLRRYPNLALRDGSSAEGIVWDDIPGLPPGSDPLLFAPGRLAFMSQTLAVSHGGLSLDEVAVPLARVLP